MQAAKGQPAPGQPLPVKLVAKGTAPGPGAAPASAGRLADSAHASWEPEDLHALVQTVQSLDALPPGQHMRSGSSSGGHSMCSGSERTSSVAPRAGASPRQAGAIMFGTAAHTHPDAAKACTRLGWQRCCAASLLVQRSPPKLAGACPRQPYVAASMEHCWCASPNLTALFLKQCPSIGLAISQLQQR